MPLVLRELCCGERCSVTLPAPCSSASSPLYFSSSVALALPVELLLNQLDGTERRHVASPLSDATPQLVLVSWPALLSLSRSSRPECSTRVLPSLSLSCTLTITSLRSLTPSLVAYTSGVRSTLRRDVANASLNL